MSRRGQSMDERALMNDHVPARDGPVLGDDSGHDSDTSWEDEEDFHSDSTHSSASSESIASYDDGINFLRRPGSMRRRGVASRSLLGASRGDQQRRPSARQTRRRRRGNDSLADLYWRGLEEGRRFCGERSSLILLCSFLFWLVTRISHISTGTIGQVVMDDLEMNSARLRHKIRHGEVLNDKQLQGLQKHRDSRSALGNAALEITKDAKEGFFSLMGKGRGRRKQGIEHLQRGCELRDWQSYSFPTCNSIHEIDMREDLGLLSNGGTKQARYIGSGLWRDVWKIPSQEGSDGYAVLKLMRGEHDVDSRNLDRHRRDALTMERLSASPYVVSIYGFCGNTVVSEYIDLSLDKILFDELNDESLIELGRSRKTSLGRLRLSLDVARGIEAMHNFPGGPIIHADVQSKQFLVDPSGIVKLNDFNRCRFMPHDTKTGRPCSVRIPTAPGRNRAPEEYEIGQLTEKIDVYSVSHIMYSILTGEEPWKDYSGSQVKDMAKQGRKPAIHEIYLVPNSVDAALATLIDLSYELDPFDRLNATELVNQLERLLATEETKLADKK